MVDREEKALFSQLLFPKMPQRSGICYETDGTSHVICEKLHSPTDQERIGNFASFTKLAWAHGHGVSRKSAKSPSALLQGCAFYPWATKNARLGQLLWGEDKLCQYSSLLPLPQCVLPAVFWGHGTGFEQDKKPKTAKQTKKPWFTQHN